MTLRLDPVRDRSGLGMRSCWTSDNGPYFWNPGANRALYTGIRLEAAYGQLTSGGTLAHCQGPVAAALHESRAGAGRP